MRNYLPALLAGFITLSAMSCPSYARSQSAGADCQATVTPAAGACLVADNLEQKKGNTEASQVNKSDSANLLAQTAVLPIRLAAVTSALAIGTPIAVVRCEAKKQTEYANAMVAEINSNQSLLTPLMVASLPGHCLQTVGAVATGVRSSAINAASAWDNPFTLQNKWSRNNQPAN